MKRSKFISQTADRTFVIEEDLPEVGFYLLIYEEGKCVEDHLQDTLLDAKEFALEEFGVSMNSWKGQHY